MQALQKQWRALAIADRRHLYETWLAEYAWWTAFAKDLAHDAQRAPTLKQRVAAERDRAEAQRVVTFLNTLLRAFPKRG